MQKLNSLWQIANAASTVKDFAQHKRTYQFGVTEPITFYLQTENTDVTLIRWRRPLIEVTTRLQGAFGWKVVTDQDKAGIYMVARRRNVVGGLSSARFEVHLPADTYTVLKLADCSLNLKHIDGTFHLTGTTDAHYIMPQMHENSE